jgi:putative transcriptional regulator
MTPQDIQDIRKALNITQERFAALLGTTVVTVNRWENGKAKPSRLYIKEIQLLRGPDGS